MHIDFLLDIFSAHKAEDAMIWNDTFYSYGQLYDSVRRHLQDLNQHMERGMVVSLEADFSPRSVALLLALIEYGCIVVPLTDSVANKKARFREIAQVEAILKIDGQDCVEFEPTGAQASHEIIQALKEKKHPGLVLFSSGSTGESKAAVHDLSPLLEKFKIRRHAMRSIAFLLFDHIGGFNTLLYSLSNAGCIVALSGRRPESVCRVIEKYQVETLPTSPTFINLLLLSEAYRQYDLSSLRLVTYGTEVMPESTLSRFHSLFPHIRLLQTYGLSEIGIMRSKSRDSGSLWVKIGGEGFQTRVADGVLEIKAQSAMLGYLNAPSPFTKDGWFHTGDAVLVDGDYLKILGRQSEMINVGGEKVFPAEVESVLQLMDGVEDAAVSAEKNPITGHIVKAKVKLGTGESTAEFRKRMHSFCKGKLQAFKIPQKVELVDALMHGQRFKKIRKEH